MKKFLFAATLLVASTVVVSAQTECNGGPRDSVLSFLADRHGETRQAIGLSDGVLVEVFANQESGTWTITMTTPDEITCLVAYGEAFMLEEASPQGTKS